MAAKPPVTQAIRVLRQHDGQWTDHLYAYEEKGGTRVSARELGVDEHAVIKTLVMQDDKAQPLLVLMHGDRQVSTKKLARAIGVKSVAPCSVEVAQRHSGYLVGGTSPFGTRKDLPVYVQASVLALPRMWINGGRRGYLVGIEPAVLGAVLGARAVECGL